MSKIPLGSRARATLESRSLKRAGGKTMATCLAQMLGQKAHAAVPVLDLLEAARVPHASARIMLTNRISPFWLFRNPKFSTALVLARLWPQGHIPKATW